MKIDYKEPEYKPTPALDRWCLALIIIAVTWIGIGVLWK